MDEIITKIKEYCIQRSGEVLADKEGFYADDYAAGNIDDAWVGGMSDGQSETCNDILEIISKFEHQE